MTTLIAILPYLIGLALAAVALTLLSGVVVMSKGGAFNDRWGNKLMRMRVATQAVAVGLMLLYFVLTQL